MSRPLPPFSAGVLDRHAEIRDDTDQLEAAWRSSDARRLWIRGTSVPVVPTASGVSEETEAGSALALVEPAGDLRFADEDGAAPTWYLGRLDGAPIFASIVTDANADSVAEQLAERDAVWENLIDVAVGFTDGDREIGVTASALLRWHESARFSPHDGSATVPVYAGWGRADGAGREIFPRTDPAVIVRIEHEGRLLLGSNALWEAGRFSLLAGFVEAGESLEDAVRREVYEESGVRLGTVEYEVSQPWPFPRSLMLGFRAELADGVDPDHLVPDPEEISELRWFTREELRSPQPGIRLPGELSIARWLIDEWLHRES